MRGSFGKIGGFFGVSSLLTLALLTGCGGGDGDTEGIQTQSAGGSGGVGGSGGSGGGASGSGGGKSGSGGSISGSGGSGQAGDAGSGQAGDAGSGQAGDAGTGGDAGSGQAGDAGSGQAGDAGTGGDAGSGQAGDAGSGQAGSAGSGQAGDAGSGQAGDAGSGQAGSAGSGQAGSAGSGQAGSAGSGQAGDAGSGQAGDGGTAGAGGSGQAGSAGSGQGGSSGGCCKVDEECQKQGLDQCVEGTCREKLGAGQCWDGSDCNVNQVCQGAAPCPCGAVCAQDNPGQCVDVGPGCCKEDKDCGPNGDCVEGMCKKPAPAGQCWEDDDCEAGSTCEGEFVCPCLKLCIPADTPGKCTPSGGNNLCCKSDDDCKKLGLDQCAGDVCVKKASGAGQCWEDTDCGPGKTCDGEKICPCNKVCGVPNTPGKCKEGGSTPPVCCKEDKDCGPNHQCVLTIGSGIGGSSPGVCKPVLTDGSCWDNSDCKQGTTCKDPKVCSCNVECAVPDFPGKCL